MALLTGVLSGCNSSASDPQPTPTSPVASIITVKVSEAGAPSYDLSEARVVSSNYQTGASALSIAGKLNSGQVLTLKFSRNGSPAANTTNALQATLGTEAGTNPSGTTTYDQATRLVDGTFSATFAGSSGTITGSFSKVQL